MIARRGIFSSHILSPNRKPVHRLLYGWQVSLLFLYWAYNAFVSSNLHVKNLDHYFCYWDCNYNSAGSSVVRRPPFCITYEKRFLCIPSHLVALKSLFVSPLSAGILLTRQNENRAFTIYWKTLNWHLNCKGPQTRQWILQSWSYTRMAKQLSMATIPLCFRFFRCRVDVLQVNFHVEWSALHAEFSVSTFF